jgi:hypothetical protein
MIGNGLASGNGSPEVTRNEHIWRRLALEIFPEQARLATTLVVKRNVYAALEAPIFIPGRDAMADEDELRGQKF